MYLTFYRDGGSIARIRKKIHLNAQKRRFDAEKKRRELEEEKAKKVKNKILKKALERSALRFRQKTSLENERRMKQARKVRELIYKQMLSKKKEIDEKAQKRTFDYAEDESLRKKTKKDNEDVANDVEESIGRIPGQLFSRSRQCENCGLKFASYETMQEHVKMKKNMFIRRQIPRATFTAKENLFTMICKWPGCCFHSPSLEEYDAHLEQAHQDFSRKKFVDIYLPYDQDKVKDKLACERCNKVFSREYHMKRHKISCVGPKYLACDICGSTFRSSISYIEHFSQNHSPPSDFVELNSFKEFHDPSVDPSIVGSRLADDVIEARLARSRTYYKTYTKFNIALTTLEEALSLKNLDSIIAKLKHEQRINGFIKFNISLAVILSKYNEAGAKESRFSRISNSKDFDVSSYVDFAEVAKMSFQNLFSVAENLEQEGSGMYFLNIY